VVIIYKSYDIHFLLGIKKRDFLIYTRMYSYGRGVKQNYSQALFWYKASADQGFAPAELNTGLMYNTDGNDKLAFKYVFMAALHNYPRAQYNLAILFQDGVTPVKNTDGYNNNQAYVFISLAALGDYKKAINLREEFAAKLTPIEIIKGNKKVKSWQKLIGESKGIL